MNHPHIWPITAKTVDNQLSIGGCLVGDLVAEYSTPLYLFDEATLRETCASYRNAFAAYPGKVHFSYASKAFLNVPFAKLIIEEGFGFDVVSLGEMQLALHAGADPKELHLHGNAKPRAELEAALMAGIGRIAIDNLDELRTLGQLAEQHQIKQGIILRIEPAVAAQTHKSIQTGQKGSKFGLSLSQLDQFLDELKAYPTLELVGLHFHLGSQLFDISAYERAVEVALDLMLKLKEVYHIEISEFSPGGGLAAAYLPQDRVPTPAELATPLINLMRSGCQQRGLNLPTLVLEPGRSISGRAGVALYEVIGSKPIEGGPADGATRYLHVDGGMGDNLRPALYGARYTALLANRVDDPDAEQVHISGRFCESGDVLLKNASMPRAEMGDLIAFATAGAYTISMGNNYNFVPRPAVVMVKDGRARLIQLRETFQDLIQRDL